MPTHKKPESERFKGPAKYVEYLVARGLVSLLQRMPIGVAYRLGRGVGWLAWKCLKRRRAIVRKNLEIVNAWLAAQSADGGLAINDSGGMRAEGGNVLRAEGGNLKPEDSAHSGLRPRTRLRRTGKTQVSAHKKTQVSSLKFQPSLSLEEQVKEVFQRAGANLFSSFSFSGISPEAFQRHVELRGVECLQSALSEERGVIIILAHMGPWEALSKLPAVLCQSRSIQANFASLYRPLDNDYLDSWIKRVREQEGMRLFSRKDGFHAPAAFIREGGIVSILADQRAGRGDFSLFFGKVCLASPLPGLMYKRTGAPIIRLSAKTMGSAKWVLSAERVEVTKTSSEMNRRDMCREVNGALEASLSESLYDVFWLHDRFRDDEALYLKKFAANDPRPLL